ncbi:MAG: carbonic anhydrase [Actinomycetes bacterium]|jgi:carbonic anhydrase
MDRFEDILSANQRFVSTFTSEDLTGTAVKGLAIVTCMDSRIDPLRIVGMHAGDAKILRNAGARVTDDVLRTLVLATHLLGVTRVLVMPHTDCRMASTDEAGIHADISQKSGVDTRSLDFQTTTDQLGALLKDIVKIESYPLLHDEVRVMGAIYDVKSGLLTAVN